MDDSQFNNLKTELRLQCGISCKWFYLVKVTGHTTTPIHFSMNHLLIKMEIQPSGRSNIQMRLLKVTVTLTRSKFSVHFKVDGPGNHLQGDPACTAWYTNDDLGRIHYDQNQCHILEVDCEEKDRFMTICMKLPASYVMPDIPCPVTTPLNTGECFSGNWTQVSFRRKKYV